MPTCQIARENNLYADIVAKFTKILAVKVLIKLSVGYGTGIYCIISTSPGTGIPV